MVFESAAQAVEAFIDPWGKPASALRKLIELHSGEYFLSTGLPGLRRITQDLWFPNSKKRIKSLAARCAFSFLFENSFYGNVLKCYLDFHVFY